MIFVSIDVFIIEAASIEINRLDEPAFDEKGDSPVQGCLGDPFSLVPQSQKKSIHIEVVVNREDLLNDRLPLRRPSKPLCLDIFPKFINRIHDPTIIIEIQ